MRITPKFLLKAFVAMMLVLFLVPVLISHMDSQNSDHARARRIKKDLIKQMREREHEIKQDNLKFDNDEIPDGKDSEQDEQEDLEKQRQNVVKMHQEEAEEKGPLEEGVGGGEAMKPEPLKPHVDEAPVGAPGEKVYGPKAVLTKGKLGNFEPDIPTQYGPGENGEAVYISMAEKEAGDRSIKEFGFNMVASDKISMTRTIPDTRLDECKYWQYPEDLPTASVILVFHNEGWSSLMRTVHSVINMSPEHLLHEVVLVDDFSDKEHLKDRLDEYVKQFNGKVKLYRNTERLGLILTRSRGAELATGDVIVFLDAHCECNKNWLPPLLARIRYDRTIMAVPIVDSISWETFAYRSTYGRGTHYRGIFEWGFLYKESQVPKKELNRREHDSEPYWSPTHAGGLFAMDRKYFFELGAYDPGLQIWGGENFELSFKIWLTGGSIEWVPCSRVGHVYRNSMPYGFGKINPRIPVILINYMRVVEVWLDPEFREYFYTREPTVRGYDIGSIEKQLEFKRTHAVHDFKWFMENVAYEVYDRFPPPPPNKGWGEIKLKHGYNCWDSMGQGVGGGPIGFSQCHHYGGNQLFRLNEQGQLSVGERCVDHTGRGVVIQVCPVQPTGHWDWDKDSGLFKHVKHNKCIRATGQAYKLEMVTCDPSDNNQVWEMNEIRTWAK